MSKKLIFYFWMAFFIHLLIFLGLSLSWVTTFTQPFEKKSSHYLPAYLYQKKSRSLAAEKDFSPDRYRMVSKLKNSTKKLPLKNAVSLIEQTVPAETTYPRANAATMRSAGYIEAESPTQGRPHDEPLLKELTRATAAKLFYPPEAAIFQLKGTVIVRFLLYPDGQVSEVSLAQSSGFRLLDNAALVAIKNISPVRDVNLYLSKPRYLLAGIVYR